MLKNNFEVIIYYQGQENYFIKAETKEEAEEEALIKFSKGKKSDVERSDKETPYSIIIKKADALVKV